MTFITRAISRRRIVLSGLPVMSMLLHPLARASSPVKQAPSPIEELIPRLTLLIATGRLVRQVFMTEVLSRKLIAGDKVDPSEMRLFDIKDFDGVGPVSTFLEVTHHRPLWAARDALGMPAYTGNVYYYGRYGVGQEEPFAELQKLIGQECVFLIDHLNGLNPEGPTKTFPFPHYAQVSDGHWREGLPLPMSELKRIETIAKQAGFVRPSNIVQSKTS